MWLDPGLEGKADIHCGGEAEGISGGRSTDTTHQSTEEGHVFGEPGVGLCG